MFERPDVDDLIAPGASFGFTLSADEAAVYLDNVVAALGSFDSFLSEERVDEGAPPVTYAARAPGYRPGPDEDPYNAWMWKCHIEGATEGLLAGKTVSFKDHTAVAGIPCGKSGGLPIGLQLVGAFYADPLLLQAAYAYQQSVDWDAFTTPGA